MNYVNPTGNQTKITHQLIHTHRRTFDLKNFNEEIYASRHLEKFMENSEILFEKASDYGDNPLDKLLTKLIKSLLDNKYEKQNLLGIADTLNSSPEEIVSGASSSPTANTNLERLDSDVEDTTADRAATSLSPRSNDNDFTRKKSVYQKLGMSSFGSRKVHKPTNKMVEEIKRGIFSKIEGDDQDHETEKIQNKNNLNIRKPDVNLIADTLQGFTRYDEADMNQKVVGKFCKDWIIFMTPTNHVKEQQVGIIRFDEPITLGEKLDEIVLVFLVLTPERINPLHSPLEVSKTFGTLLKTENFIKTLRLNV